MATGATALTDLTLPQHRARAGTTVDAALKALRRGRYVERDTPAVAALHALDPDALRSVVIELFCRATARRPLGRIASAIGGGDDFAYTVVGLYATFGPRAIPWTRGDAAILLELGVEALHDAARSHREWLTLDLMSQPVAAVKRVVKTDGLGDLRGGVEQLAEALRAADGYESSKAERYRARLFSLLDSGTGLEPHYFNKGDTWGATWVSRVAEVAPALWPLLRHLPLAGSVTPTRKWQVEARSLAAGTGAQELLRSMLDDVERAHLTKVPHAWWASFVDDVAALDSPRFQDRNALVLRGAIWAAALTGAPWVPERLGQIGLGLGTGRGNMVPEERIANTCAAALGTIDDPAAFAALGRLKAKVTNRNVSKQIAKALDVAAERAGISPSELIEMSISTMGLDGDGRRREPIGDCEAILAISADGEAGLTWVNRDGVARANPPKAVADGHADDVRRVKEELKELRKALTIERGRLEDLFVEDRTWDVGTWRTRYVEHPLTGTFGRRLIWRVASGKGEISAMPAGPGGTLVGADGAVVKADAGSLVSLWHPISASTGEVEAWRGAILDRRIRQPFKQAFRELYVVTPAEEATETYSNRFAGHILQYSQARALMATRRWGTNFLGPFDGGDAGDAKRDFPSHRIRAHFYHDALFDVGDPTQGEVAHCTTDQVRFMPMAAGPGTPIPVRDVPPTVFSEAMRDVDLFVGVTSVGADRNWQDAGADRDGGRWAQLGAYFDRYWDSALSANAQVRRDAIARILPGLTIADRCELQDRWLRVRGDIRTYRIHLGSGNILMEPKDQYLCIVPARGEGPASKVFLPFDDDPVLSLVLSKAFLLANDSAIRDRSIIRQIEGR